MSPEIKIDISDNEKRLLAELENQNSSIFKVLWNFIFGTKKKILWTLSFLWSLLLGPWSGLLAAVAWEEDRFQVPCVTTLISFLTGLLVLLSPNSRILSRLWIASGAVMVTMCWISSLTPTWSDQDQSDVWSNICLVKTIFYILVCAVPVLATDNILDL